MQTIELTSSKKVDNQGYTSKGDQPKWNQGNQWYKADHMGYESLSEIVISRLLDKSNIPEFVKYSFVNIKYDGKEKCGCVSKSFLVSDENLITFEKLHRLKEGVGLAAQLGKIVDVRDRIQYTVDFIEEETKLSQVGEYITSLIELDTFFLNEDRHTNNLAVIRNNKEGKYKLCPIFDNGLALLSDLYDYPLNEDIYQCMQRIYAKPFSRKFDAQLDAAEELYGEQLKFSFTKNDIAEIISEISDYYDDAVIQRVIYIIHEQMRKYFYFFTR